MRRKILKAILPLCCFIFLNFANAYSDKLNFHLERLSTDYNGVAYNGRVVLAYGKYGVIIYSTDQGETWKQISLGDKQDVLKVATIDAHFYVLTPHSILKTTDDGLHWTQKILFDEPELKDFTFDDKFFYLTTKNTIYRVDLGLSRELETLVEFDEFTSLGEIVCLKNYIFSIDGNYYIYRVNLQTKTIDTIDIHQTVMKGNYVRDISHLKVYGSTLYLLVESIYQNDPRATQPESADVNIRHYLLKSDDLGNSWEIVTGNIRLTKEYQVFNGTVYFLTHKGIRDTLTSLYYYTIRYFKINPDGNEEEINKDEILAYRIPIYVGYTDVHVPNTFRVNMFVKVGNQTLIAVGPNKTILRSRNDGRNWELVSYFKPIGAFKPTVKFVGRDTVLVFCGIRPYFFRSFDRGVTFLPPRRKVENFPESGGTPIVLGDATFGFIDGKLFAHTEKKDDSTYIIKYDSIYFYFYNTTDWGETFLKKIFYRSNFTSDSVWYELATAGITQGKILCVFTPRKMNKINTLFNSYFYLFDKSFNLVDSIEQNKIHNLWDSNLLIEDTVIYYLASSYLYSSKDFGRNWEALSTKFTDYNSFLLHFKNYILIYNVKQVEANKYESRLLKFNLSNSALDTLSLPSSMRFFVYDDTLLAYKYDDNRFLYFFPMGSDNLDIYDSIEVSQLLSGQMEPILINNSISNGKDSYFYVLKDIGSFLFNRLYELNLAKVVYGEPGYLLVEPQVEKSFVYLYNFSPYPMPARDYLASRLYWDLPYTADDIKIAIYDVLGNQQEPVKAEIEAINSYSGVLRVDCSSLPNGVYTAVLSLASKTLSIPFILNR